MTEKGVFRLFTNPSTLEHSYFEFVSSFGLPWRDMIAKCWCFVLASVHVLITLLRMPGLGQGFRDSNLVTVKSKKPESVSFCSLAFSLLTDGFTPAF